MMLLTLASWSISWAAGNACGADDRDDGPAAGREDFNDDFNGTALDRKWSWYNPPAAYDVGITTPGQLHMVSNNNCNFGTGGSNGTILYQNMSGNCVLETKVTANPNAGWEKTGIMIMNDAGHWTALKYQLEGSVVIEVAIMVGGSFTNENSTTVPSGSYYLRLVKDGSDFNTYWSSDGSHWNRQWSWSQTFTDPFMAGLLIADGFSNANFSAEYDYFHYSLPNRPPGTILPFTPVTFNEDEKYAINASGHFKDPDGDILSYKVDAPHIKGNFNYAINDIEIYGPANWFGSENVLVTATDPSGKWVEALLNVTVLSVEDSPFLNRSLPTVNVPQNGTDSSLDLSKYFQDNDTKYGGDSLTYSGYDNGSLTLNITPAGRVTLRAPINFWGVQVMAFSATDRTQLSASGSCNVMVSHVNQAPQVVRPDLPEIFVNEDESVVMDFGPVFKDPDGDPITFVPSGNVQIDVAQTNGTQNITFRPKPDASGFSETIKLTAKDNSGLGTNFVLIKVTVIAVNDPPRITRYNPGGAAVINENQSQEFNITTQDAESGPSLNYTWYLDGQPVVLGVPAYVLRTDFNSAGNHTVMVVAGDGELFATRSWNVTVLNVNREPTELKILTPAPGDIYTEGMPTVFDGSALDADGDALVFSWYEGTKELGKGPKLTLVLPAGAHAVVLRVSDGVAAVESRLLHFTVKANASPKLFSLDPYNGQKFNVGTKIRFTADAGDTDGDDLTFCWTENGKPLSTSAQFYKSDLKTGSHVIHLTISDGKVSIETDLSIEITEPATSGPGLELIGAIGGVVAAIIAAVAAAILLRRKKPPTVEATRIEASGDSMGL
jgi:regulation of enolase protein 1 (concanavalin A-like superfamily)